ncbi:MAG: hypothetical protein COA97_08200 [Flavobacteriales bacterium]|nr:MAG: hypothetical protein COA97_08200 [Flavobacteriales bacterium]
MNNYINLFKTDFFSGVIALSKKTWLNITYAYSIYYLGVLVIGGIFIAIAFLGAFDTEIFSEMLNNPSPEDSLMIFQQISDLILTPEIITSFILVFIIMLIMASWNYYFAFITSDIEVKGQKFRFVDLLKISMKIEVFKLAGISIVLYLIVCLLFIIAISTAAFSGILAFFMFLFACVVSMRFILVLPAFIIGNYDFNSSFAFSFHHINWARALKLFGISILAMLVLIGISLLIGIVSVIFSLIPFIGPLIQIAINVLLGAIMMSITVSSLTGLYYRYANSSQETTIETSSKQE